MVKTIVCAAACILTLLFASCATIQPGYEKPVVSISSFDVIPSQSIIPRFKIGLHIVNPNRSELNLKGISYTIALEGHKIMTGVSNDLPVIDAYGEGDVVLNASVDIFSSIRFFTDLINNKTNDEISYNFSAKLDSGGLLPLTRVNKEGKISLTQPTQGQ